jgi:hypothetical protein
MSRCYNNYYYYSLVSFLIQKNTQKFPKGERERKKGTHTKYCAKFLCKWDGAKVAAKKSMQWLVFFFSQWMLSICAPSPKKEKYPQHWICIFICIFVYLIFQWILSIYAQKDKK